VSSVQQGRAIVIERGTIRLNIERGASVAEFKSFLDDLETAYLAVYALPSKQEWRSLERRFPFPIEFLGAGFFTHRFANTERFGSENIFPLDQIEITKISIQSPGFVELLASFNPLQQIREYLKDRHERKKDKEWRWESEKARAAAEVDILRIQAERDRTGAIRDFYELLDHMDLRPEEKQKILWERVGVPLARLGKHQDSGLLGSQNDNVDGHK
jgi:hypothetical protein